MLSSLVLNCLVSPCIVLSCLVLSGLDAKAKSSPTAPPAPPAPPGEGRGGTLISRRDRGKYASVFLVVVVVGVIATPLLPGRTRAEAPVVVSDGEIEQAVRDLRRTRERGGLHCARCGKGYQAGDSGKDWRL